MTRSSDSLYFWLIIIYGLFIVFMINIWHLFYLLLVNWICKLSHHFFNNISAYVFFIIRLVYIPFFFTIVFSGHFFFFFTAQIYFVFSLFHFIFIYFWYLFILVILLNLMIIYELVKFIKIVIGRFHINLTLLFLSKN
jgi:hypothetical protein